MLAKVEVLGMSDSLSVLVCQWMPKTLAGTVESTVFSWHVIGLSCALFDTHALRLNLALHNHSSLFVILGCSQSVSLPDTMLSTYKMVGCYVRVVCYSVVSNGTVQHTTWMVNSQLHCLKVLHDELTDRICSVTEPKEVGVVSITLIKVDLKKGFLYISRI